jgi:predicted outer membrane repeat protein
MNNSDGIVDIKSKINKENIEIEISNSGPKIPSEILDKVFEPLFTTKEKGTGLGLSSCKNIIEQQGGAIYAKNNPTTFTIILPKKIKNQ